MSRPRLLDLFCGAGGAAVGYHRAGFDVVGVDINPQPRFPFKFVHADALEYLSRYEWEGFDAVHASPPCQAHTTMSNRWRGAGGLADERVDLIPAVREMLTAAFDLPFVIENVPGARSSLRSAFVLHGGMFGLGVYRPRLFESNVLIMGVPDAPPPKNPVGVYGKAHDGRRLFTRSDGTEQRAPSSLEEARAAMGVDWMEWRELAESIPPAYTEFIGGQLMSAVLLSNGS